MSRNKRIRNDERGHVKQKNVSLLYGFLTERLTISVPFFASTSSSTASLGLNGYWESIVMLEGIVMYCVFASGFFRILLSAVRTIVIPSEIHMRAT